MSNASSFLVFLALQRERILRLGRSTPHASGLRKPALHEQDTPPDPLEDEDED